MVDSVSPSSFNEPQGKVLYIADQEINILLVEACSHICLAFADQGHDRVKKVSGWCVQSVPIWSFWTCIAGLRRAGGRTAPLTME